MTHHTDAELLPCPFCGGKAEAKKPDMSYEFTLIKCQECDAQTDEGVDFEDAAEAWNLRAPEAPVSEPALEAALNAMDKEVTRMQPDRSVHWIGFTRDDRLRVVAAALAAAPQPPEAAPVRKPLTDAEINALADAHMGLDSSYAALQKFAHAIERAHGIKD